jgi:hypothetical protein
MSDVDIHGIERVSEEVWRLAPYSLIYIFAMYDRTPALVESGEYRILLRRELYENISYTESLCILVEDIFFFVR